MKVIIDRFENDLAVVEIKEGIYANIPKILIPNAKEGDVINISIDNEETKKREEEINNLMNQLFK